MTNLIGVNILGVFCVASELTESNITLSLHIHLEAKY